VRLVYAEVLKIRTAPRTLLGLLLALVTLMALGGGTTASSADNSPFQLGFVEYDLLGIPPIATIFSLMLGVLAVTWEYRHGTITQTFLATPRRERVIAAKLAVSFVVGAALAVLAIVTVFAVARFWIEIGLERGHWELMGRIVLAAALWGVFGCGLGALVQSQVGAIVIAFVWFLVAEPLLRSRLDEVGEYLPGAVLERLLDNAVTTNESGVRPEFAYGLPTAALLAAGYAAVLAAAGVASALRRDVT
jgi:ABC-2 type transport system permease protein